MKPPMHTSFFKDLNTASDSVDFDFDSSIRSDSDSWDETPPVDPDDPDLDEWLEDDEDNF